MIVGRSAPLNVAHCSNWSYSDRPYGFTLSIGVERANDPRLVTDN